MNFVENMCGEYDPLHHKVVQGVASGMTDAELRLMHGH